MRVLSHERIVTSRNMFPRPVEVGDVRNFYEGGKLIRRELDLDGDGRMDKVETHP
jgi:hypothetical protein